MTADGPVAPGLGARTIEEADRRRFGLWAAGALILILPPWWFVGSGVVLAGLRPLAGPVLAMAGLGGGVTGGAGGDWIVATNLTLADGSGTMAFTVSVHVLRRLLLGVPLFLAFLIAPPRPERGLRALVIGTGVLIVVFFASLIAFLWGEIAPMLNPDLAARGLPVTALAGEPLNPIVAQIALVGRYLAMSVLPLIVAVVLWAVLNPRGREALLGRVPEGG